MYLSVPCVPIKVVFYLLKLHYEFEAVRGDAAFFGGFFSPFYCCARFKPLPEPSLGAAPQASPSGISC